MLSRGPSERQSRRQRFREQVSRLSARLRSSSRSAARNQSSATEDLQNHASRPEPTAAATIHAERLPLATKEIASDQPSVKSDSTSTQKDAKDAIATINEKSASSAPLVNGEVQSTGDATNIWSAAFDEAVRSFGQDLDVAILKGKNIDQIFAQLQTLEKDTKQESYFLRGVAYLRKIQVPLEKFKWALDLTGPFAGADPTAKVVFGVVTGVTTIAISLASADLEFAKQIGEMLEQLQYIDECDTLGQRTEGQGIHKALISVYRKILEFYKAAFDILSKKGAKRALSMVTETNRLPALVQDLLKQAEMLHKIVSNATAEILNDIKNMLYNEAISAWLDGDRIKKQSQYHATLQDLRADQACNLLLEHPNFDAWYNAPKSSRLVVVGDVGTGKSVTAGFVIDTLIERRKSRIPRPIICYYYCRDDETGQITYLLSVIVLSLLEQLPGLKKTFYDWYQNNQLTGNMEPAKNPRKLEEFLNEILSSLDRPLFIVIDGLDECDRHTRVKTMELLRYASKSNSSLKSLVFSRRNEEVLANLEDRSRIDLLCNADRDHVIVKHTVHMHLGHLSSDVKELVIEQLSSSANGSAIWTKMMVKFIEECQIRARVPMQRLLKNMHLPSQLSSLYDELLRRRTADNPNNQQLAQAALKILAGSARPLSVPELAWAVALVTAPPEVSTIASLSELVDEDRVLGLINPFITLIDDDRKTSRQISLVHQSVREYVIQLAASEHQSVLSADKSKLRSDATESEAKDDLHAYVLDICMRYLLLDEIDEIQFFSDDQLAVEALCQEPDLFGDLHHAVSVYDPYCTWDEWETDMPRYDPVERGFGGFFAYSSSYWVNHYGAVNALNLPKLSDIEKLCAAGSRRFYNWTQQNCRPGCVVKSRFEFVSEFYDPLSITAIYGSDGMLQYLLEHADLESNIYLPDPFVAAVDQVLLWGDLTKLRLFYLLPKEGLSRQKLEFWNLVLMYWTTHKYRHHNWEELFMSVDHMRESPKDAEYANELLCMAARAGCIDIVQRLFAQADNAPAYREKLLRGSQRDQKVSSLHESRHQSIGEAVLGNHVPVIEFLLLQEDIDAHLNFTNADGEDVLHLAATHCNPAVLEMLVPRLSTRTNRLDKEGDTPLMRIMSSSAPTQDRLRSARILILGGTAESRSVEQHSDALRIAIAQGDLDLCSLLVSVGSADPRSAVAYAPDGRAILKYGTPTHIEKMPAILQMLTAGGP